MCLQNCNKITEVQTTFLFETFLVRKHIDTQNKVTMAKVLNVTLTYNYRKKIVSKIAKQKYDL